MMRNTVLLLGVSVMLWAGCPPGPCKDNAACPSGDYCERAVGQCAAEGVCAARPEACTLEYNPVCGCDGKTYGNACAAAMAGVSVAAKGECKKTCAVDGDCPQGQVCELDVNCAKPMVCAPGCHVDAQCAAGQVCVRLACLTCPCPGQCRAPVGCKSNADCTGTEYCAKVAGDCAGAGTCTTRPQACIDLYDPVCGCDGKTHGNACAAAMAGTSVASKGPCKTTCTVDGNCPAGQVCELDTGCTKPMICVPGCHMDGQCAAGQVCVRLDCLTCPCPGLCKAPVGCKSNADCTGTQYCAKAVGGCAGAGTCTERPAGCEKIYQPVCGCDGKTYGNACMAAMAGVAVAATGTCKTTCTVDGECPAGQVCELDAGCAKPMICVPGCHVDGQCAIGQTCVKPACLTCPCPGTCKATLACKSNADCTANTHYCAKAVGDCAGAGTCTPRPQACDLVYDPVCGCDGKTYSNACAAAAAGVAVAARGACKITCTVDGECPAGQVCELDGGCAKPMICVPGCHVDAQCAAGQTCVRVACLTCPCPGICKSPPACKSNADCAAAEYCAKTAGDCAGAGKCAPRPKACIDLYDPVCGCDGKTYGNACAAAVAGVSVAAKGPCRVPCTVDKDCPTGQVCELDFACAKPMYCVPGCHVTADCPAGMTCKQRLCLTCPCPGVCS